MERRRFLKFLGGSPIAAVAAGLVVVPAAAREQHMWYHFSVLRRYGLALSGGKYINKRLHICVRGPSRELALNRLQIDDPVWSHHSDIKFHGTFLEIVEYMPLPDRFVGWELYEWANDEAVLEKRIEKFARLAAESSGTHRGAA